MSDSPITDAAKDLGAQAPSTLKRARRGWRGKVLFGVKLIITAALCVWITTWIDWGQFWIQVQRVNAWLIGVVVILRFVGLHLSAYKWQRLLAVHGLAFSWGRLSRWYYVGMFLNYFLPTSIGGDAYRVYKTWRNNRSGAYALAAVFAERATGLLALMILGWISSIVVLLGESNRFATIVVWMTTVGLGLAFVGVYGMFKFRWIHRLSQVRWFPKKTVMLVEWLEDYGRHPIELAKVGAISFLFHINKICVVWLLLFSLGENVNWLETAVAVAVVELAGMLPISLGGLGVVEGSFMFVTGQFGVPHESALAAMVLMRVLLLPMSLIGALFYFFGNDAPEKPVVGRSGVLGEST